MESKQTRTRTPHTHSYRSIDACGALFGRIPFLSSHPLPPPSPNPDVRSAQTSIGHSSSADHLTLLARCSDTVPVL